MIHAVLDRKDAGVDVRVMLNSKRSGGDRANDETYRAAAAAGVAVQWANPKFYVTHEKSIVVDESAALVATFNLCEKYFTAHPRLRRSSPTNPQHVAQIVEVFNADWEQQDWQPTTDAGLLWSNSNSRKHMAHFIDTAQCPARHPASEVRRRGRFSITSPRRPIAASTSACCAAASTGSASGTSSTPSPRCAR